MGNVHLWISRSIVFYVPSLRVQVSNEWKGIGGAYESQHRISQDNKGYTVYEAKIKSNVKIHATNEKVTWQIPANS